MKHLTGLRRAAATLRVRHSISSFILTAAALSAVVALPGAVAAQAPSARDLFGEIADIGAAHQDVDAAIKLFSQGKVADARNAFTACYKAHPELPPGDVMLAQLLLARQQFPAGLTALESAVKSVPNDPEASIYMAEYCISQKLFTAAEALAVQATDKVKKYQANPKRKASLQLRILNVMASVLEARQNWKEAAGMLLEWANVSEKGAYKPKDAVAASVQSRLGQSYYLLGMEKEARDAFQKAKAKYEKSASADLALALMSAQKNDGKAAEYYAAAAKAGESDLSTQLALTRYYLDEGKIDEAKRHADKAGSLDPKSLEAKILRGVVARVRGDATAAEALFKEAHMLSPADFTASNQLALVLVEQPQPEMQQRALALAEIGAKLYPNNADALATLAWVNYRAGNGPRALEIFNQVRNAGGMTPDGSYYVAKMLMVDGQEEEAKKYVAMAMQQKVSFPLRKDLQIMADKLKVQAPPAAESAPSAPAASAG